MSVCQACETDETLVLMSASAQGRFGPSAVDCDGEVGDLCFSGFCCFIGKSQNFALSKHFSSFRNWIEKGWQKFHLVIYDLKISLFYG